jgi:hypothetical protein
MTEHEQLEYAAKACGIIGWQSKHGYWNITFPDGRKESACHNWVAFDATSGEKLRAPTFSDALQELGFCPESDQADSDRMACALEIDLEFGRGYVWALAPGNGWRIKVIHDNTLEGKCAAVREARLLVAVEIGGRND